MKPRRPLAPLLVTQSCGAFNDSAWAFIVLLLMEQSLVSASAPASDVALQGQSLIVSLCLTLPLTWQDDPERYRDLGLDYNA